MKNRRRYNKKERIHPELENAFQKGVYDGSNGIFDSPISTLKSLVTWLPKSMDWDYLVDKHYRKGYHFGRGKSDNLHDRKYNPPNNSDAEYKMNYDNGWYSIKKNYVPQKPTQGCLVTLCYLFFLYYFFNEFINLT